MSLPRDIAILDCSNRYVTAGFRNSHVHFIEATWPMLLTVPRHRFASSSKRSALE
jgi:predicted amidohydrolase YtcJ